MAELATFEDDFIRHPAAKTGAEPVPAAAIPPPAEKRTRLTPTQAAYVQAWMKRSGER
jgi:hypothetical protein